MKMLSKVRAEKLLKHLEEVNYLLDNVRSANAFREAMEFYRKDEVIKTNNIRYFINNSIKSKRYGHFVIFNLLEAEYEKIAKKSSKLRCKYK